MDYSQILRGFLALLFVLALIGGVTVIARYFRLTPRASKIIKSSKKRLSIVEVLPVDAKVINSIVFTPDGVAPPANIPRVGLLTLDVNLFAWI